MKCICDGVLTVLNAVLRFRLPVTAFVIALPVLALIACESNPYPPGAQLTPQKPPPEPQQKVSLPKTYQLDVQFEVVCNEGELCTIPIRFSVTNDQAVLSVENLPSAASFDPVAGLISWIPSHADATESQNENGQSSYLILVDLRGSTDTDVERQRAMVVIVRAKPS